MHSKIFKPKNKATEELKRLKERHGSTTSYRTVFELQEVAESLGLPSSSKQSAVLIQTIANSRRFLDMSEDEISQLPVSGRTERILIDEHKKQKAVHYSFIKEIENL